MTSTLGRPRHATAHRRVRVAHALTGGAAAAVWLLLPATAHAPGHPVAAPPTVSATVPARADTSPAGTTRTAVGFGAAERDGAAVDLALPLVVAVAAVLGAGYGYVRRTRRLRTRTTPAVPPSAPPEPGTGELERRARAALVDADDWVRASAEELSYVPEAEGGAAREALRAAETELAAAFALFHRCAEGVPEDAHARRQALAGVIGRCEEAGRRLDAQAPALDRLRGLEPGAPLAVAERRFRELTARAAAAQGTVAALRERYGVRADRCTEVALDRLVFATARLNEARRAVDAGDGRAAARQLRAAEGAIAQAGVQVDGVERLAARLAEAAGLVPAALAAAEQDPAAPARAEEVLAAVREVPGPYDPLEALRRITGAVRRPGQARAEVLHEAARLVAESAVDEAADYIAVRRGAVGVDARTLLAAARQALAARDREGEHDAEADVLARRALESAEADVGAYPAPYAEEPGHPAGLAGAVLGGVLLGAEPDGGPPVSYGGPATRDRRGLP
ncbi:hypothetical protein [Streptomyces sp. LaPpAH-108]|uniref:hypothetical protein n=1 Tax=Streptomyces sp. LaPpAH-108 TaxID=1155714 RepID=UPI000477F61A|nr:hypothetical protein [Streptomyces sp. LaPpAH-108]